jgi:hypothetical protein
VGVAARNVVTVVVKPVVADISLRIDHFEEIADRPESSLGLINDWDAELIRRAHHLLSSIECRAE